MQQNTCYVGLMSGTSADATDAVIVDFAENKINLVGHHSVSIPSDTRKTIHALAAPGENEIDRLGELDNQLGDLFANVVLELLNKYQLKPHQIAAIGSHGQTIRHRPPQTVKHPFTLQIGDPNIIAQRTGITTVADFRRRDMAAGGQGAPLVPAFHKAIFQSDANDRVIVNIGGMANITFLPQSGDAVGFDTGPGNVLMDAWILENSGKTYDANGEWAASGSVHNELLQQLLSHPFFALQPPKSTGREVFNPAWLRTELDVFKNISSANVQATLLAFTAQSISNDIKKITQNCEVYVCGGGAYNLRLLDELQIQLPTCKVSSTANLGVAPEWIEAMAFAWLAKQTMHRQSGNLCAVTGAQEEVILGGVYFA